MDSLMDIVYRGLIFACIVVLLLGFGFGVQQALQRDRAKKWIVRTIDNDGKPVPYANIEIHAILIEGQGRWRTSCFATNYDGLAFFMAPEDHYVGVAAPGMCPTRWKFVKLDNGLKSSRAAPILQVAVGPCDPGDPGPLIEYDGKLVKGSQ